MAINIRRQVRPLAQVTSYEVVYAVKEIKPIDIPKNPVV